MGSKKVLTYFSQVFTIVDALKTPSMPVGATKSFVVPVGGEEHQKIQEALKTGKPNEVLVKDPADGKYSMALPGADGKFNQAYIDSEG